MFQIKSTLDVAIKATLEVDPSIFLLAVIFYLFSAIILPRCVVSIIWVHDVVVFVFLFIFILNCGLQVHCLFLIDYFVHEGPIHFPVIIVLFFLKVVMIYQVFQVLGPVHERIYLFILKIEQLELLIGHKSKIEQQDQFLWLLFDEFYSVIWVLIKVDKWRICRIRNLLLKHGQSLPPCIAP